MRFLYAALLLLSSFTSSSDAARSRLLSELSSQHQILQSLSAGTTSVGSWTVDGIKGILKENIFDFNTGVSMPLTSGPSNTSRASGRCVWRDITITRNTDASTPTLMLKVASGADFRSITLTGNPVPSGNSECTPTYTLESSILTSLSTAWDSDAGKSRDTITMNFKSIKYSCEKSTGGAVASTTWSLEQNKGKEN